MSEKYKKELRNQIPIDQKQKKGGKRRQNDETYKEEATNPLYSESWTRTAANKTQPNPSSKKSKTAWRQ